MATPHFPKKTLDSMRNKSISKSDVLDTFHSGEYFSTSTGAHMMVKRYPSYGYKIGLYYLLDNFTGRPVITSVWERKIV